MKICDNHIHIEAGIPINDTVINIKRIIDENNYDRMNILALPTYHENGYSQNYEVLYLKDKLSPKVYASVGWCHNFNCKDTADYYLDVIKNFYSMGCDGVKIIEGKPDCYRKVGRKLNDKIYDKFFAFCEEKGIPVTMHLGDPATFWDWEKATEIQKEKGWIYSKNDATLEQLRSEAFGVLKKFPKLKLIFAHFCFMSEELERAENLFEEYENLYFDLTPGVEMYLNFSRNYDNSKEFFNKYADRILYGTDASDDFSPESWTYSALNIVRPFMEGTEEYINPDLGSSDILKPFGFGEDILQKIYRENFIKLYGEIPRPLDYELIAHSLSKFMKEFKLTDIEIKKLELIEGHFKNKR